MLDAAKKLAELDVGAMPICGEDDRLKGMLTDRDIVVKVLAQGKDPASAKAGELGARASRSRSAPTTPIDEALRTMTEHKVRRLPVIDGHEPGRHHQPGRRRDEPRRGEGRRPGRGDLRRAVAGARRRVAAPSGGPTARRCSCRPRRASASRPS